MSMSQLAELCFLVAFGCYVVFIVLVTHGYIARIPRIRIPVGRHFRRRK